MIMPGKYIDIPFNHLKKEKSRRFFILYKILAVTFCDHSKILLRGIFVVELDFAIKLDFPRLQDCS